MTVIAFVLILIIIGALLAARKGVPGARACLVAAFAASLVLMGAKAWMGYMNSPSRQRVADEEAAGSVLGGIFAREVQSGSVLILRNPPRNQFETEISALRFKGFSSAIKDSAVQQFIAGPNIAKLGTDDPSFMMFSDENLDTDVRQWFASHPDVKVLVSLCGTLCAIPPGVTYYGFADARDAGWADAVRKDRIKAAIMYRIRALPPETAPETNNGLPPKFMLITKDTLDEAVKAQAF